MLGMARLLHAMRLQPAEAARVGEEFLDGEGLAAHDQDDAVEPGAVECVPVAVGQRADIDIGGDRPDARVGLVDLHGKLTPHALVKPRFAQHRRKVREETMHRIAALIFAALVAALPAAAQERLPQPRHHHRRALRAGRRQRLPRPHPGRRRCGRGSTRRWWSRTSPAPAARSARCRSPRPSPTATRCCSTTSACRPSRRSTRS